MAIIPFSHSLQTEFRAPADADVREGRKRDHVYARPPLHLSRVPHVQCEVRISTEGTGASVRDFFDYQGAIPSSPVLLGADRTAEYRRCAKTTGFFGWSRLQACLGAGLIGAAVGCFGVAVAMIGPLRRLGYEGAKLILQVSPYPLPAIAVSAAAFMLLESAAYARVSETFSKLRTLSAAMDDLRSMPGLHAPHLLEPSVTRGCALAREMQGGDDWVLARAGEELLYEAAQQGRIQDEPIARAA